MTKRNGFILSGLAIIALIIASSCSLASQDLLSGSGITLNIGDDNLSRLITVKEFDVTSLDIALKDGDETICAFNWTPYSDWSRKFIPLLYGGRFEILVTHHGEKDGETVSVTESAKFRYDFGIITIIKIVPGLVGVIDIEPGEDPEPVDVTGNWDFYYTMGGVEYPPMAFYLDQSGDELTAPYGFTGMISDTTVTLRAMHPYAGYLLCIGDLENDVITGYLYASDEFWTQNEQVGTFRLDEPSLAEYGPIVVSGTQGIDDNWDSIIDYDIDVDVDTEYGLGYIEYFGSPGTYGIDYLGPGEEFTLVIEILDPNLIVSFGSGPVTLTFPDDFRISLRSIVDGVGDPEWFYGPPDYPVAPAVTLTISQLDAERFAAEFSGEYPFDLTGSFNVGLLESNNE